MVTDTRLLVVLFPQKAGSIGGTQTHVEQLIKDFSTFDGFTITVISGRSADFSSTVDKVARVIEVFNTNDTLNMLKLAKAIIATLKWRPHVIHSHGYESNWIAAVIRTVSVLRGTKAVWIATVHGWGDNSLWENIKAFADRLSLLLSDGVIFVGNHLRAKCFLTRRHPWVVVFNAVDCVKFSPPTLKSSELAKQLNLSADTYIIGTAGRLSPEKGQDVFLAVAEKLLAKHSSLAFVLAGHGDDRARLEQQSKTLGINNRVFFLGLVRDMPSFYHNIDLFLLTSYAEGTPRVLLEATASGVPVIAANVGSVAQLIPNELHDMLLTAPRDVDGFVSRADKLIECATLRVEIARTLRAHVLRYHQSDFASSATLEFFSKLLG